MKMVLEKRKKEVSVVQYISYYHSRLGVIQLISDGVYLIGLSIEGQMGFSKENTDQEDDSLEVFFQAKKWLTQYFSGLVPDTFVNIKLIGTPFQLEVWDILRKIPYGEVITYGEIATIITKKLGKKMSAQAVGQAVGKNPISIMIPCHRVVGKKGKLVGYNGGIYIKKTLLKIETTVLDF